MTFPLEDANHRPVNNLPVGALVFPAPGWCVQTYAGGVGDFFELVYPPGTFTKDLTSFVLYVSGGIDGVREDTGQWFRADRDRVFGCYFLPDGSIGEEEALHRAGKFRFYLLADTQRLCVLPVNEFGQKSYEPTEWHHLKGPASIDVPAGGLFILSVGDMRINFRMASGPHIVDCTTPRRFDIPAGCYGGAIWRRP
jgi:hypothetical protein